jgi:hypothetical protein
MTNECPCGSLVFPKDAVLLINTESSPVNCSLLHENKDILVSTEQTFKTISSQFSASNIVSYTIQFPKTVTITNKIKLVIKSYNLDKILAILYIGSLNQVNTLNKIDIYGDSIVLFSALSNDRLRLEISSVCDMIDLSCCDSLPASLSTSCLFDPCEICINTVIATSTTSTTSTTTASPSSCCDLNVGDTGTVQLQISDTNPSCPSAVNLLNFISSNSTYRILAHLGTYSDGYITENRYYIKMNNIDNCISIDGTLSCNYQNSYFRIYLSIFAGECLPYANIIINNQTTIVNNNPCNNIPPNFVVTGTVDVLPWGCNIEAFDYYLTRSCGRYEIRAAVQPCCANGLVLCHEIPQCAPDNYFCVPPEECGYTYSIPYNDGTCYVQRQALGDGSLQCPEGWFYDSVNNTCYYRQCSIPYYGLPESIQYTRDCGNGPEQLTSYNISWIDTQA